MKSPTRHLAIFAAIAAFGLAAATNAAEINSKDQYVTQKADAQVNAALIVDTGQQAVAQQTCFALVKQGDNTLVAKNVYALTPQSEQQAQAGALQKATTSFQPGAGLQMINTNLRDVASDSRTATPQTVIATRDSRTSVGVSKLDATAVALQVDVITIHQIGGVSFAAASPVTFARGTS